MTTVVAAVVVGGGQPSACALRLRRDWLQRPRRRRSLAAMRPAADCVLQAEGRKDLASTALNRADGRMENELVRLDRNYTVRRFSGGFGCVKVKNKKHGKACVCLMGGPMID